MTAEQLGDRLRRLRREKSDPVAGTTRDARDESVKAALARRDERLRRGSREDPIEVGELAPCDASSTGLPRDLEHVTGSGSALLARRQSLPRDHRHGAHELAEIARANPRAFVVLTGDESLADVDLEQAIYLDTETSGLAGGSGTYVFMVGLGTFSADSFELWQGFLDDPAHEATLLAETAERIRAAPAIVSFFGKSFDRHRLEDRMRCLRIDPPFEGKAHLDLYHPLRRVYRGAFQDHRLRTLEHALCGLERADDLPGSQAPAAWFDFLAGRSHRLEGVFRHNRDDVLSLVTLAAHLGSVLEDDDPASLVAAGPRDVRAANLSRSLARAGDPELALRMCDAALLRGVLDDRRAREARVLRAELLRSCGDARGAVIALHELVPEPEDEHTAAILLALARLEQSGLADVSAAQATCSKAAVVAARRHTGRELARIERELASLRASCERKAALAVRRAQRADAQRRAPSRSGVTLRDEKCPGETA